MEWIKKTKSIYTYYMYIELYTYIYFVFYFLELDGMSFPLYGIQCALKIIIYYKIMAFKFKMKWVWINNDKVLS